jgi:integrase/recombinase XerD
MSRLRTAAQDYLAMRRTLGFKLTSQGRLLLEFIDYCEQHRLDHVDADAALRWATNPPRGGHDRVYHARRLMVVRIFARHLAAIDPATEIPPPDVLPYHYRRVTPHVFTTDEIDKLIGAATRLQPALRAATWRTLLGLLAVTGMRISEACNLNVDDIDEDSGVVRIVNTKFNKSRQVLLDPTTLDALADYRRQRRRLCPSATTPALLINSYGGRQQASDAPRTFRELVDTAGIVSRSGQRRPRLHDIRHSVAVWSLMDWYRDGGDVQARLPLLSTWLGHIDPKSTYWYLQAVPELLALAAQRLETDSGQVRT